MNHKTHYNPTTICSQTISSPNMTRQCFHQMNRSIFHGHCSRRLGIGQMRGDRITFLRWIIDRVMVQIICFWLKKLREPQNPFSDWRLFNVSVLLNDTVLKVLVRPMVPAGIISLSIKKLAEKAKSPPCQPRLSQGSLCAPRQPQAVT